MRSAFAVAAFFALSGSAAHAEWYGREAAVMGTAIHVELWCEQPARAEQLMEDVIAEMRRIDAAMSPYRKDSELFLLNAEAAQHPVKVSAEMFGLIEKSLHYSDISRGAFDITFASVGYRYDYRRGIKPTEAEINQDLDLVDYHHLRLDPQAQTIAYAKPGVRVDLGGIAKGHAVDGAIRLLRQAGIKHALVSAGGDSGIIGDRRGRLWMVGIRHPRGAGHAVTLPLEDISVSTSGDYERYFDADGKRYHHILNPGTGKPAGEVSSVTILGEKAVDTDALSTTVFVLGVEEGLALVNRLGDVSAVIIDVHGKVHYSDDLVAGQ